MNNYKYLVKDTYSNVWREVFPLNGSTGSFDFERKDSGMVFEKKFSDKLTFSNNTKFNITDFDYFKFIENNNKCEELEFRIDIICNDISAIFWEGVFSITEGNFNNNMCTFEVKPRQRAELQKDLQINILDIPEPGTTANVYTGALANQRIYTNCRFFKDVIFYVAKQSNSKIIKVISDFFQINPTVISTDAINGVFNDYTQMIFAPLSQVQEPLPSNNAIKEFISFEELMNDLNALFNVYWFIDSNYNLRIEHYTWFDNNEIGMDLTTANYSKWLEAKDSYSYDLKDFPRFETFRIVGSESYCRLTYSGCGLINKNKNEISKSTTKIHTDFYTIRYNGYSTSGDRGLFLFACRQSLGHFNMIEYGNQNAMLMASTLVMKFFRHGRPDVSSLFEYFFPEGSTSIINSNQGEFLSYSVKPTKKQIDFSIPFCCGDEFEPYNQVKTPLGLGFIEKAKLNQKTNVLTLSLKYKTVNDNVDINPKEIGGLRLWLKGDVGVVFDTYTNRVSEWKDQSGNNLHAIQPSLGLQPFYDPINKMILPGSGYLKTPAFQLFPIKRGSIFIIYEPISGSSPGDDCLISTNNSVPDVFFDISIDWTSGSPDKLHSFSLGANYPSFTLGGLLGITRDSDTTLDVWQNGLRPSTGLGNPMTIPNTQVASNPLFIGRNPILGGGFWNIKEIIIYDRAVTNIERQQLELYIMKKWNINLYTGF